MDSKKSGGFMMERLVLEEVTQEKVTYRYYPEQSKTYGVVVLMRKTGQRILVKLHPDYSSAYVGQAWKRLDEYQKTGDFPEKDLVAWG